MAKYATEEPRSALPTIAVPTPDTQAAISSFEYPSNHRVPESHLGRATSISTTPQDVLTWSVKATNANLRQGRRFDMAFVQEAVFSAEGAIYGERGQWVVAPIDVVRVCHSLAQSESLLNTEALIWDSFTWKETAILGAITTGSRDGEALDAFCRIMER